MIETIKFYFDKFKLLLMLIIWLVSLGSSVYLTKNYVSGQYAESENKALKEEIEKSKELAKELSAIKTKNEKLTFEINQRMLDLPGVQLNEDKTNKDKTNETGPDYHVLHSYIQLQQSLRKEINSMFIQ